MFVVAITLEVWSQCRSLACASRHVVVSNVVLECNRVIARVLRPTSRTTNGGEKKQQKQKKNPLLKPIAHRTSHIAHRTLHMHPSSVRSRPIHFFSFSFLQQKRKNKYITVLYPAYSCTPPTFLPSRAMGTMPETWPVSARISPHGSYPREGKRGTTYSPARRRACRASAPGRQP